MKNHVIICGYGRTGKEIADQLMSEKISTLIIEIDSSRKVEAEERGFNVLLADATMDETLLLAGVRNCRSLVVTLPSDAANLYVVLSAKALNNNCRLIARAATEEASNKLKLAGADAVVSPYVAAGRTMAASALRPIAVDFIDLLAGSDCEIEEFKLTDNLQKIEYFNNQTMNIYDFSKQGEALLLATKVTGQLTGNPKNKLSLSPGMILIFLGSQEQLNRIRVHLKDVLEKPSNLSIK
tara:strand:- start:477 stop:1193 length:717 start_codon:yes stop_codon:yes gene_type:complete